MTDMPNSPKRLPDNWTVLEVPIGEICIKTFPDGYQLQARIVNNRIKGKVLTGDGISGWVTHAELPVFLGDVHAFIAYVDGMPLDSLIKVGLTR